VFGAAGLLAGIGLVVLAAATTDLTAGAVHALWRRSNPVWFVLAFLSMTIGLMFLALRWRAMMTERASVRVLPLTAIFTVGTLLNYALPGPVGEFAAAALAGRRFNVTAEMAFAAGVHARFLGLSVAGTVSLLLFLTTEMPVPEGTERWVGTAAAALAGGAVGLGALSARPDVLARLSSGTLGRVRLLRRLDASLQRFATALGAVGRLGPGRYAVGAAWALCGHATVVGGVWLAAYGLGASPDPAGLAFTYAMATAGAVVLFAFPGSQVGWDAMFASLLVATAGLQVPDALAVTLLVRTQQLFTVLLGGLSLIGLTGKGTDDPSPLIG
jgi:uncharacterized membrane protein YbhN (UPF0104 family)